MKITWIVFCVLFLVSCQEGQEKKLLIGNWNIDAKTSWQRKIKPLNQEEKQYYEKLHINSRKKRLANYEESIGNITFSFRENKDFSFKIDNNIQRTGIWEIFSKDETLFLVLQNKNKKKDIFQIEQITQNKLILRVDKSNVKIVLNKY